MSKQFANENPSAAVLCQIWLFQFRNYADLNVELAPGHNLFIGENGIGKSNLMEGMHLLSATRSFRSARDKDMIKFGAEIATVRGKLDQCELEIRIPQHGRRSALLNGATQGKVADILGRLPSVCFSTADMDLIRGEGADRRRMLDLELCQASTKYLVAHAAYGSVLRHRNALLKELRQGGRQLDLLAPWDQKLAENCEVLRSSRREYLGDLNPLCSLYQKNLSSGTEEMHVQYQMHDAAETAADFLQLLNESVSQDIAAGHTTVGAHRDDLRICINGESAKQFASQGQQRTSVLSIKLAQLAWWRNRMGVVPLLLLDDIFSDLDPIRRSRILSVSGDVGQVVITATDATASSASELRNPTVFSYREDRWVAA